MVSEHTYYLASTRTYGGVHASNPAWESSLQSLYADEMQRRTGSFSIEAITKVDGSSAWLDEQGDLQVRVVINAVSHAIEDEAERAQFAALLKG